ncbi:MAG: formate/nitrite transporter family protein [Sphingomonas sp.]|nr:formate/nitrite transporter family protein [Sphingomonas sp.]MBW0006175.1 formate/nitrite transporter family protein [Sphingomonas sp.]
MELASDGRRFGCVTDREQMVEQEKQQSPLSDREIEEADDRSSTSAKVVHEAIRLEGQEELERPNSSIAWSGLAAGLTMGCSMLGQGMLQAALPDAPWRELVASFGYTLGFIFVTMARQQLFTETTLTVMLPVLHRTHGLGDVVRYWSIVFVANIIGTILFAAAASIPQVFSAEAVRAFTELGGRAVEPGFIMVLVKGVFAGWLIALMVWLMPAASSAKFFVIIAVTWLIAAGHFSHVIAGSAEAAFAALHGVTGWDRYLVGFLLPALIGNSIGGVVFVALLNHAQVKAEI